jgi:hypothetical protein
LRVRQFEPRNANLFHLMKNRPGALISPKTGV